MKEFVMIIRLEDLPEVNFSPEEMQAGMKVWENEPAPIVARERGPAVRTAAHQRADIGFCPYDLSPFLDQRRF